MCVDTTEMLTAMWSRQQRIIECKKQFLSKLNKIIIKDKAKNVLPFSHFATACGRPKVRAIKSAMYYVLYNVLYH
jgi:hypothetical protein